jgi:phospho-N-acetylmuramoyl-pentapeptide-transferase
VSAIAWALGGAYVASLVLTPLFIAVVRRLGVRQVVRRQGPERHLRKEGTPTMGGVVFVGVAAALGTALARGDDLALTAAGLTLLFALVGMADDLGKVLRRGSLGLRARTKLAIGLFASVVLVGLAIGPLGLGTFVRLPLARGLVELPLWAYVLLVVLVVLGTTNAVNITDGLDGLAAGVSVLTVGFFAAVALADGAVGLGLFLLALAGALAGFLYFNLHPARVFMGDAGALAIGAALAAAAVLTRSELLLPLVGGVYVLEALSVMVQVAAFRLVGRRVLRMSPLHHHFELSGWPERRVVQSFWLLSLACSILGYFAWW